MMHFEPHTPPTCLPFVDTAPAPLPAPSGWEERALVEMLTVYRGVGGVASGDDLAALLRHRHPQPISVVARWLVHRAILSFPWRGQTLIPLFQFDRTTMCPRADILAVVHALADVFTDWELASWFTTPNAWLDESRPVMRIGDGLEAVLRAARADRCIALG